MSERLGTQPELQPHQAFAAALRFLVDQPPDGFIRPSSAYHFIRSEEKIPNHKYWTHYVEIFRARRDTFEYRIRLPGKPENDTPRSRDFEYFSDQSRISVTEFRYPQPGNIRQAVKKAIEGAGSVDGTFGPGLSLESTIRAWQLRQLATLDAEVALEPRDLAVHEITDLVRELYVIARNGIPS